MQLNFRVVRWLFLCICGTGITGLLSGCGGRTSAVPSQPLPAADHVFVVVLENHSFDQVMGNSAMPYLNSLAKQHALATNYFAVAHPSIPNYFMLTTGKTQTLDDAFTGTISDDNTVRALTGAGRSWTAYIESLPSAGYTGPDSGAYAKRHNPFAYLTDVTTSSVQAANMVPFTNFQPDLAAGNLASFVFIVPDLQNDGHDCPAGLATCSDAQILANTDNWLKTRIDPLLQSTRFGNSLLIITWDEAAQSDISHGGGHVATVLVGPHVKSRFASVAEYQHQSVLRTVLESLGVTDLPGAASNAPSMAEFFQ